MIDTPYYLAFVHFWSNCLDMSTANSDQSNRKLPILSLWDKINLFRQKIAQVTSEQNVMIRQEDITQLYIAIYNMQSCQ